MACGVCVAALIVAVHVVHGQSKGYIGKRVRALLDTELVSGMLRAQDELNEPFSWVATER